MKKLIMWMLPVLIISNHAYADQITWFVVNSPPMQYFEDGEYKGYGIEAIRFIAEELTKQYGYTHKMIEMNYHRMHYEFENKKNACVLGFFKNPMRDKIVYWGIPDILCVSEVLFTRDEIFRKLGKPKMISLDKLLRMNAGILGLAGGRNYIPSIRGVLDRYKQHEVIEVYAQGNMNRLFDMLFAKRIDFVIEWPPEGRYLIEKSKEKADIKTIIIKESQEMSYTYYACTKTEWGKKVIERINPILRKIRPTEVYRQSYEKYLEPDLIPMFRKYYDEVFLKAE